MAGFFGLFDFNKAGPGVSKDEVKKTGFELYFDIFLRRFWKFITLNIFHVICSIPSIIIIWFVSSYAVSWGLTVIMKTTQMTADLSNAIFMLAACMTVILAGIFGTGAPCAAQSYVLRNYVNDTHSWVFSDFTDNLKNNFKQATAVFIIDVIIFALFLVAIIFYTFFMKGAAALFLRAFLIVAFLVYAMMHMYIYQIMAKFTLTVKQIYVNSFLLTVAKLPWNLLAFAVECLLTYLVVYLLCKTVIFGILAAMLLYFSINTFTYIFMTNNIVNKYLLYPALAEEKTDKSGEAVFSDDINTAPKEDK